MQSRARYLVRMCSPSCELLHPGLVVEAGNEKHFFVFLVSSSFTPAESRFLKRAASAYEVDTGLLGWPEGLSRDRQGYCPRSGRAARLRAWERRNRSGVSGSRNLGERSLPRTPTTVARPSRSRWPSPRCAQNNDGRLRPRPPRRLLRPSARIDPFAPVQRHPRRPSVGRRWGRSRPWRGSMAWRCRSCSSWRCW